MPGRLPDGRRGVLGSWAVAGDVSIRGGSEIGRLSNRYASFEVYNREQSVQPDDRHVLQALVDAEGKVRWLGLAGAKHVLTGGGIVGIYGDKNRVRLIGSELPEAEEDGSPGFAAIDRWIWKHPCVLGPSVIPGGAEVVLMLRPLFGSAIGIPKNGGDEDPDPQLEAGIEGREVVLGLRSHSGRRLGIRLDVSLRVVSATVDGRPIAILLDPRWPIRLKEWSSPFDAPIATAGGVVTVPAIFRHYRPEARGGNEAVGSPALKLVVSRAGGFWVGPQDCRMALVGDRLLGFFIRDMRTLCAYPGERMSEPLPEGPALVDAVERRTLSLERFEAARRYLEGVPIDMNRIAQELPEVANASDISFRGDIGGRGVSVEGKTVVLALSIIPGGLAQVRLDEELRVVECVRIPHPPDPYGPGVE